MAAAHNDIFTKTIGALPIDMVKTCVKKMEILDRIYRIDMIRSNPVYLVNPVKRFD